MFGLDDVLQIRQNSPQFILLTALFWPIKANKICYGEMQTMNDYVTALSYNTYNATIIDKT